MKKWILAIAVVFCICLLPFYVHGEALPVPESNYPTVLRNGDTVHVLWLKQTFLNEDERSLPQQKIENGCYCLKNGVLVACDQGCSSILGPNQTIYEYGEYPYVRSFVITPQNITYAVTDDYCVYRWTPEENECWTYLCALEMDGLGYSYVMFDLYAANDGTLYASFTGTDEVDDTDRSSLYAFDLQTGKRQHLGTYPYLGSVYNGSDNTLVIIGKLESDRSIKKYLLDPSTMELRLLMEGSKYGTGTGELLPSKDGGWYTIGQEAIVYISQDGTETKICDVPRSQYARNISLSMDESVAYFAADGYLYIYRLQEGQLSRSTLTIAGDLPALAESFLPDYNTFCIDHQTDVMFSDLWKDEEELTQALLLGEDTFDLMLIDLRNVDISVLMEKGYVVNLSKRAELAAYAEQLYPVWTEPCTWQDEILALPVSAVGFCGFEYNSIVWNTESLGDIPTTYDELFDCIERWDAEGILDVYSLFGTRESSFERLLWRILMDYVGVNQRQSNDSYTFHQDELVALLQRLEEIKPILTRHDAMHITGDPLIYADGNATMIVHRIKTTYTEDYLPLLLSICQDEEPVQPVFLYVMMVNPHSPNQELALDFLAYLAANPTGWTQCVMMQEQPDGILSEGSVLAQKEYEDELIRIQTELENAKAQKDWEMASVLQEMLEQNQSHNQFSWEILPEMTDKLYAITPYWSVLKQEGYGFLTRDAEASINDYLAERITLSAFLDNLDNTLRMKRMEKQ